MKRLNRLLLGVGRCVFGISLSVVPTLLVSAEPDDSRSLPSIISAQNDAEVAFLPDFSFAGFANGLAEIPVATGTVVHVKDHGAVPNDGKDDTKAVLAAISHANSIANSVIVRFDAGRYRLSEVLRIERSNLVLQGAGSGENGTTLHFLRPLNQVDRSHSLDELRKYLVQLDKRQVEPDNNLNDYFSEYSWSGGFIWVQKPGTRPAAYLEENDPDLEALTEIQSGQRGKQTITVADSATLDVGDVVQVQWVNRDGPGAGIIKSLYGSASATAGSHHWSFPRRPLVVQSTKVLSIDANAVRLADPLLHDVNAAIPAEVVEWEHLQHVGIEDLHIAFPMSPYFGHHMERGYNGIYLTSAYDSWATNIRISNADSGILTYNSANITYRDIVTDGQRKAHYAVHMGNVHNVLAERVTIKNPVLHSLTFNTQSTKCVYKDALVFVDPTLDQHAGSNHQNLFDNVTLYVNASNTKDGPVIPVFDGSGAGYWQPGHGGFNTTWNLRLLVIGGAYPEQVVTIQGLDEGPMARIVGLHGNREFKLDYRPTPYVEKLNVELQAAPSLYDYQLSKRIGAPFGEKE